VVDTNPVLSFVPPEHVFKVEDSQDAVGLDLVGVRAHKARKEPEAWNPNVLPRLCFVLNKVGALRKDWWVKLLNFFFSSLKCPHLIILPPPLFVPEFPQHRPLESVRVEAVAMPTVEPADRPGGTTSDYSSPIGSL
jgi:hypothetical protein